MSKGFEFNEVCAESIDCWPRCAVVVTFCIAVMSEPPIASLTVPRYVLACVSFVFVLLASCCSVVTAVRSVAKSPRSSS